MIVGIDIDSTLAEWPECEDWHLLEPIDLIPFANCVNVVNGWANDGATIVYITYRSDRWRHGILSITVDWLKKHGLPNPTGVYSSSIGSKIPIIRELGIAAMIEDDIEVCKECVGANVPCFLHMVPHNIFRIENQGIKLDGISTFHSWNELDSKLRKVLNLGYASDITKCI